MNGLDALGGIVLLGMCNLAHGEAFLVPPDDSRIGYSDFVRLEQASDADSPTKKTARFDRILDMLGKGYRWDNPGSRIRFRTDAIEVRVFVYFTGRHISLSARNPVGRYRIDGRSEDAWTFCTGLTGGVREPEAVEFRIPSPSPGSFHDYELILPYGDAVEFRGLCLAKDARLEAPPSRPPLRLIAYGDSITQGFTASETSRTYAFLLAEKRGWQLLNMGFGGRAATPSDGKVIASLAPDFVTVLMGTNDWQGGVPVDLYRLRMEAFLSGLREDKPAVPVFLITPLWVPPSWKPKSAVADLEDYRQALRDLASTRGDPHLHLIEGVDLIDHTPAFFDRVAVHPNDQGFAQMAGRLDKALSSAIRLGKPIR